MEDLLEVAACPQVPEQLLILFRQGSRAGQFRCHLEQGAVAELRPEDHARAITQQDTFPRVLLGDLQPVRQLPVELHRGPSLAQLVWYPDLSDWGLSDAKPHGDLMSDEDQVIETLLRRPYALPHAPLLDQRTAYLNRIGARREVHSNDTRPPGAVRAIPAER